MEVTVDDKVNYLLRDKADIVEQISKCAMTEQTDSSVLTGPAEWLLYYRLRDVYRDFRRGTIKAEQGTQQKNLAIRQYRNDIEQSRLSGEILHQHAKMWQRIEQSATAYRKERTTDNADRLLTALYGV